MENADFWHREWQGGGSHAANAKKIENCKGVGGGTKSGKIMAGKVGKWSLQRSVRTFAVWWREFPDHEVVLWPQSCSNWPKMTKITKKLHFLH